MPSRRALLAQAAGLAGFALTPGSWTSAVAATRMVDSPFGLGVASGEPSPDGMVLWTRLASRPREPLGGMPPAPVAVRWEIAADPQMKRTVARGRQLAVAEAGHSVHVEVSGLRPGREYWYRFMAGGHASPIGRTRTTPAAGSAADQLKLAFASCQKYSAGYYSAHAALAADAPDLVLFLGEYNHEVANDYGDDQDRTNPTPADFLKRRAAAYQAFYENMPLRRTQRPVGPDMLLYRSRAWGDLARIQMLDTRQYRNHRTCEAASDGKRIPMDCPERSDPARSLLGQDQERWLQAEFRSSRARWNLLGQQYLMEQLMTRLGMVGNDGWDGYAASRRRVLEGWRDAKVSNPVVLGGDIHCFFAGELALTPDGPPVASEFVGGSISSLGAEASDIRLLMMANRRLTYGEGETRGYGRVELTPKTCTVTFRGVENALVAKSPVRDLAKFVVEDGVAGAKRV